MSYLFDGATSKLVLASALVTAAPLTLACFFKSALVGAIQVGISADNGASDTNRFVIYLDSTGVITGAVTNTLNNTVSTAEAAAAGLWNSMAYISQSVTSRYAVLNGRLSAQSTTSRTPAGITELLIGAHGPGTFTFNGLLAEVAIWAAALTPRELQTFNGGMPANRIRPESLLLYMPLTIQNGITDLGPRGLVFANTACIPQADHPNIIRPTGVKPWQ